MDSSKRVSVHLICWLLLALPLHIPAQEPAAAATIPTRLTLDLAREILLLRNPTILRERQNVAIARADMVGARQLPNPTLEMASESYPLFEANPGRFFDRQELVFRVGQTIETAGKRRKRTRVTEQDIAVAQSLLQDTIRQLILELRQRYYRVVLAKAEEGLAKEVIIQFDEIIRLNEVRYRQGEVSGLDLTRVQTERLRFFNDLVEAQLQLQNAKAALLELLGVEDMTTGFDVAESLQFAPLEVPLARLQEQALQVRADLVAGRQIVERERRRLTLEKARATPNITPFFGYKRDFGDNAVVFGVDIPLPFFNRNQGGIERAHAQVALRNHELQRVNLAVRRDVQQAYQLVQAQDQRVRALETTYVASARRARDIAQASYRLGALDLVAFLDAERAYRETLRGYYQALYDHQFAIYLLEAAVGKEL